MRVKRKSLHVLVITTASLILGIALWPAGLPPAAPSKTEIASQKPGEPPLKKMPEGAAAAAAAGRGQIFESIVVSGYTDIQEGTNGLALADLNKDGLVDIVATYSRPRGQAARRGGDRLRVFINQGGFIFKEHEIKINGSSLTAENFGFGPQIPNLADFNKDGFLDIFVTRNSPSLEGKIRAGVKQPGNTLLVSQGAWDVFADVSDTMGIRNAMGYNRQSSIGDVNKDGWLDIAVGCDNIGDAMGGLPYSRLYIFQPKGDRFEDGTFKDIGGTDLVPDFGGFFHDSARDKAGPGITLRDLDNDGDLDLIQSYHADVRASLLPYSPGEYRQGVFCWKNLLAETGQFRFEKVMENGLACSARLRFNKDKQIYEPVGKAPGLPYLAFADVDNDGLLGVLGVGSSDPAWAPRTEYANGRFWRNLGRFRFQEETQAAGLDPLGWTYRQWLQFWNTPVPPRLAQWRPAAKGMLGQPGLPPIHPLDHHFYGADAVFGDFNNDGWVDFVYVDRTEQIVPTALRAVLFQNKGQGVFEPVKTEISGLDGSGICAEAADLNNDGLLDLMFAADPDNTGAPLSMDRYEDKVYWNTGEHGGKANHWLRLRFAGMGDAELAGARVEARDPAKGNLIGLRIVMSNHSYKSGGAMDVHFGLGRAAQADVLVILPDERRISLKSVEADAIYEADLPQRTLKPLFRSQAIAPRSTASSQLPAAELSPSAPKPFSVETSPEIMLHDAQRSKDLPVTVYYPKDAGKFPLIVFSHGAGGSGDAGLPIAQHWAGQGYIVICPTHDDSIKLRRSRGEDAASALRGLIDRAVSREEDWINRPKDISFVLDSLDMIEAKVPALQGKLNRDRIGMGGHSLGAYTAQVIGGATVKLAGKSEAQSFADARVKAILQLSGQGRGQQGLHEHSWDDIRLPMMCITGTLDRGAQGQNPDWRRDPFALSPPGEKYFLFIQGANHGSFTGRLAEGGADPTAGAARLAALFPRLGRRLNALSGTGIGAGGDQKAIFDWVEQATTAFWNAYLKNVPEAKSWLESDSIEQISRQAAKLEKR